MNDLVVLTNGVPMVDSVLVAKKFGKIHRDIMDAIHRIFEADEDFWRVNFYTTSYVVRGKEYPSFMMTRDGFSLLAMGFTGKDAMKWKIGYINAFNSMEQALKKDSDKLEWKQARIQSKEVRRNVTDTIKQRPLRAFSVNSTTRRNPRHNA